MTKTVETERLILRPIEPGDWRAIHCYSSQLDVVRYLPHQPFTESDAQAFALRWSEQARLQELAHQQEMAHQANHWPEMLVALRKSDGRLIGHLPFERFSPKYRTREIGWVFEPEAHGQGYATEAARALLDLAFDKLGLHRIVATCDPRNDASRRVMERLGMRREGHFIRDVQIRGEWADEYFYAILAEEWAAQTRPR